MANLHLIAGWLAKCPPFIRNGQPKFIGTFDDIYEYQFPGNELSLMMWVMCSLFEKRQEDAKKSQANAHSH